MLMYEELKENGATRSLEQNVRELEEAKRYLTDRIRLLERDLADSEK